MFNLKGNFNMCPIENELKTQISRNHYYRIFFHWISEGLKCSGPDIRFYIRVIHYTLCLI